MKEQNRKPGDRTKTLGDLLLGDISVKFDNPNAFPRSGFNFCPPLIYFIVSFAFSWNGRQSTSAVYHEAVYLQLKKHHLN